MTREPSVDPDADASRAEYEQLLLNTAQSIVSSGVDLTTMANPEIATDRSGQGHRGRSLGLRDPFRPGSARSGGDCRGRSICRRDGPRHDTRLEIN